VKNCSPRARSVAGPRKSLSLLVRCRTLAGFATQQSTTAERADRLQMNGRDLSQDHGSSSARRRSRSLRMAWSMLTRVHAVREPFHGYWQTVDYGYWDHVDGHPVRRALGEMKLKSQIRTATGVRRRSNRTNLHNLRRGMDRRK